MVNVHIHTIYGINIIYIHMYIHTYVYVTRFGKMCIVHTSDYAHLEIHKNHREWYTDVKLSGVKQEW